MTEKKSNAKTPTNLPTVSDEDSALFGIDAGSTQFDWGGLDKPLIVDLVTWVARGGGLCSVGSSSDGISMYFSIRLGKQSKGYKCDTPEDFRQIAPRIVDAWKIRVLHLAEKDGKKVE